MSVNPEGRLGRNTKSQTPIFKHQTPSSKHQKSSKSQAPRRRRRGGIGIWSLGILWCLELGFWSCIPLTLHGKESSDSQSSSMRATEFVKSTLIPAQPVRTVGGVVLL